MADASQLRSQPKAARRTGRSRSSSGGKQEPFRSFEPAPPHQSYDQANNTGAFGKQFEPQNGTYLAESGHMRDLQLNGNSSYTPHSESSESERIAALHGSNFGRTLPTDTIGLQQFRADLHGELGRLAKIDEVVTGMLNEQSEVQRLTAELREERERARTAEDRVLDAEAQRREEAAKGHRLQQQVAQLVEREGQMQQALQELRQHGQDRESTIALWKEERRAAEADAATRIAAAEALSRSKDADLQAALDELHTLRKNEAERQPAESRKIADLLEAIEQWRELSNQKEEKIHHLGEQVWHFQNEMKQMDAHYRRELDALVAQKAASDAELARLRMPVPQLQALPSHPLPTPERSAFPQPPVSSSTQLMVPQNAQPMPNGAATHGVPQKGIKNGSSLDSTQRNVSQELQMIMSGSSSPNPALLTEQALVDALLAIVPRGEAHARKFGAADHQQLEAKLGNRWDQQYKPTYGTIADFMRTHPEAFYQRSDGAFYRPDAPARHSVAPPAAGAAAPEQAPPSTAQAVTAVSYPVGRLPLPGVPAPGPLSTAPKKMISTLVTPAAPPHLRAKRAAGSTSMATPPDTRPSVQPAPAQQARAEPARAAAAAAAPAAATAPAVHRSQPAVEKVHPEPKASGQPAAAARGGNTEPRPAPRENGPAGGAAQQPQQALAYLQAAKNAQKRDQQPPPPQAAPLAPSDSSLVQKGSIRGGGSHGGQGRAAGGSQPQQQQQQQNANRGSGASQQPGANHSRRRGDETAGKRNEGAAEKGRPEAGGEAGSDASGKGEGQGRNASRRRRNQRKGNQPQGQDSS